MVKIIYRVLRSIIFSLTLLVVGFYVLAYILVSIPAFTNRVKNIAARELSTLLGGRIEIESLNIYPFNEVTIDGIELYSPDGEKCVSIDRVGGGIRLWQLLTQGRIELTYGEIIGLNADIVQKEEGGPLNIQFLLDAFASKDDQKEKKEFELGLRNVVLRKSTASFKRPWLKDKDGGEKSLGSLDLTDLKITDLAADVSFPKISDRGVEVDLRRLSFNVPGGLKVEKIGLKGKFEKDGINMSNFILELPSSRIAIPEVALDLEEGKNIKELLKENNHVLEITQSHITPSDFAFIYPPLSQFNERLPLNVEIEGNMAELHLKEFLFGAPDVLLLTLSGMVENLDNIEGAKADIETLELFVASKTFQRVSAFNYPFPEKLKEVMLKVGDLSLKAQAVGEMEARKVNGNLDISSSLFAINAEGDIVIPKKGVYEGEIVVNIEDAQIEEIFPKVPIGSVTASLTAEGMVEGKESQGSLSLVVDNFDLRGKAYDGFSLSASREGGEVRADLWVNNSVAELSMNVEGNIEGEEKNLLVDLDLSRLDLSDITDLNKYNGYILSGNLSASAEGRDLENLEGVLALKNFSFTSPGGDRSLHLNQLKVNADFTDSYRALNMKSDWADLRVEGDFKFKDIPGQALKLAESVFPALIPASNDRDREFRSDLEFDLIVKHNNALTEFFQLPVRLLVPVTLSGSIESSTNTASLTLNVPYLQQGRDKLIYDSKIVANLDGETGVLDALIETTMPVKKGDLALNVNVFGKDNGLSADIHWVNTENSAFKGLLSLDTKIVKNELSHHPLINLEFQPSVLQMGPAEWHVDKSLISYSNKKIDINNLKIWHEDQYVKINGIASPEYEDVVTVSLADIDVDYVFDMLQINYVTFGGTASGEVSGHALLSGNPVAETESIVIKDFTYNGCPLGVCVATSRWNNEQKEIEISADISHEGQRRVLGSGGIWLGRDSLSFDLKADKVPVDFVQPFMAVFSSHVGGYATGDVKLFGTFHDIDMTGKIYADSVAVKLDYTNTIYHGSDSVFLNPGQIEIPHFELYDKNGNSALLTGELTHRYFHDPSFVFRLTDAQDFLCYDTSSELNPDWYGTLYGTGSAYLTGEPGLVNISADMTVTGPSVFTFVLNDTQYAHDYQFLTFSDKKKDEAMKNQDLPLTAEDFKAMLKKRMNQDQGSLSRFGIDIRATVTPQTLFTLVMDPAAGDKITARGRGAMQVKYESDDDEMMMYGKYEIVEGNYNFSLQDIILRDFKIKEGSYISFNGNPLAADLDISATYRVNTNLSDLDKSFSTDRDLNRTNVPVDAVLSVNGNMQSPDITFDIELPTLTQDVERKVKSIISTDDMMNRQIIYLLALNRFYTPEYMGASGNGGELAAVASSTISSQLSNILGQLTDKFSVSPSFRSDKGDFSDIEVDVALSSRLLNNRLLINGNFGYRDRSNSSTTFVGDFDVEYLLSKNGNLRLKAYNHFNDQNYYLREALTTQGLGVVYRRDFDHWFTFLKKRKEKEESPEENLDDEREDERPAIDHTEIEEE